MNKLIISILIFFSVALFAQEEIVYNTNPTLQWDAVTEDSDGNPLALLPEDMLNYEIYIYDTELGDITTQPIESLTYLDETQDTEYVLTFPYRSNWACAIRTKITDGDGNISVGELAYTVDPIPITLNGPFVYAPILIYIPKKVEGLRDSGM